MTKEGVQRGGREKNTSSGNRGGEDLFKETRALWQLPTKANNQRAKTSGAQTLGNYAPCDPGRSHVRTLVYSLLDTSGACCSFDQSQQGPKGYSRRTFRAIRFSLVTPGCTRNIQVGPRHPISKFL